MLAFKRSSQLWKLYIDRVRSGEMHSLEALGLTALKYANERSFADPMDGAGLMERDRQLADPMSGTGLMERDRRIAKLLDFYRQVEKPNLPGHRERSDEAKLVDLGVAFVNAASNPNKFDFLKEAHQLGFPVNFQHPSHLGAALHKAAFFNNEKTIKWLISTGECDYSLLDKYQRTAVDLLQLEHPYNEELGDELTSLTYDSAEAKGIRYFKDKEERVHKWHGTPWYSDYLNRHAR